MGTTDKLLEVLAAPEHSLPVPPATDRRVWTLVSPYADVVPGAPWVVPLAHQYARVHRDGDRDEYEQILFALQRRLSRAAVTAAVTLDPAWVDEAGDGATVLCELSSWCWPAHDDTWQRHRAVVPTVTDPYLDLGAGEIAAQLAWLDHLLGELFDRHLPGLRARIRYEVDRRVLIPFERRRDWHWLGLGGDVHNWCAWIHGNILVAALRLVDDPVRRARLVAMAVAGLDRYAASLPPDGAIDEGYSYWWNGACRALEALDVLAHASSGAVGAIPGSLRASVAFPHRMHLGGGWYVNHADGWARPPGEHPWDALHRAARRTGDTDAEAHAAAQPRIPGEAQGLGRLLRCLTDPAWLDAGTRASPLPREVWLPSTQVLLARPAAGSSAGLTLVAKGGHNGEHHNHNDVGSVMVARDGVPVLVDAGRPTYTARTFGPDRYEIWTMQSSWHNVPEIRGTAQAPGPGFAARDVVSTSDGYSALSMDLAAAYPRDDIRYWRREARLDRSTRPATVIITDEWALDERTLDEPALDRAVAGERTRIHWLIHGTVRAGRGRAVIHPSGVSLRWSPADAPAAITVKDLDDPMLTDVWGRRLTRLEIDVTTLGAVGRLVTAISEDAS